MKLAFSALMLAVAVAALPDSKAFAASDTTSVTQPPHEVLDRRGRGRDAGPGHRRR